MSDLPESLADALADRYRLERKLGEGGMATVYLAQDLRHDRQVAIKVLRPQLAATVGPERFVREIRIAAHLQHPHILPLLDSGEAAGFLYYVMPYVEGESLRNRLARSGELPIAEAVKVITEIVDALSHAHARGVVHRDIKPDNVLLSGRHALVMDFGVAKAVSEATGRNTLTTAGVAIGTPMYMAPEQAAADPHLDHRVDIYAVGVLAYELLGGRPPFTGGTPQQVLAAHVTEIPEPLSKRRPGISPVLELTVMKCLAKRPADRFQTADELLAHLEPLATSSGGLTPTQTRPLAGVRLPRRIPLWLGWTLGGALVAGGALALTLGRSPTAALTLGKRTAVAVGPEMEEWPAFSPEGKTVVYTVRASGTGHLYVRQVDGGAPLLISTQLPGYEIFGAVSPDGSRVLYRGPAGLYIVPTLGGQARQVVSEPETELRWGSWSPDGRQIVYTVRDTLFVQDLEQSGRRALASGSEIHSPAWSPDGGWIAFVVGNMSFHRNGNLAPSSIGLVPSRGGDVVTVTDSSSLNTSPVWFPGRMALLFVSDRDGGRDVYEIALSRSGRPSGPATRITAGLGPSRIAISADGTRLAWSVYSEESNVWSLPIPTGDSVPVSRADQITTGVQSIETVALSPDGAWLYYDSDLGGSSDIWRIPLKAGVTAGPPQQITTDPAAEFSMSVSPDGRELAFHSFRAGNRDIYVMTAAGGPAVQVTTSPAHDWNPRWSPDGRSLLFDEQVGAGSSLWLTRRRPDGSWEPPERIARGGRPRIAAWAPSGRALSFSTDSGLQVLDLASGGIRRVHPTPDVWTSWSADGRSIYLVLDRGRGIRVLKIPSTGGPPVTLVYGEDPERQVYRYGLAVGNNRFYFPLIQRKADVWVSELARK